MSDQFEGWIVMAMLVKSLAFAAAVAVGAAGALIVVRPQNESRASGITRASDGRPDFSGVWQTNNTANWDIQHHLSRPVVGQQGVVPGDEVLAAPVVALGTLGWMPAGLGVVEGNEIPYRPDAAAKKRENFENRLDRDPELKCFAPGVPRAMYLPFPFQIFQGTNKIEMVFEFANAGRTIHLDEVEPSPADTWMGHSVGRWDGDTLLVDVTSQVDRTWFDRAGNFHSAALHVVERYTPMTRDAIWYEATIEDSEIFTRSWKVGMPLYRRLEPNAQLLDFRCVSMVEETMYGHLRKEPLVRRWEGLTMTIDITRKIPADDVLYER